MQALKCKWSIVFLDLLCAWMSVHTMTAPVLIFLQVMRETKTQVKWPSKLKIGAKSKKGEKRVIKKKKSPVNKSFFKTKFSWLEPEATRSGERCQLIQARKKEKKIHDLFREF